MPYPRMTRRAFAALLAAASAASCGRSNSGKSGDARPDPGSLEWAAAGSGRIDPERDRWRRPVQTLRFWGIEPEMSVLEILPGRGWLTTILAPYLARNGGQLTVAMFDPRTATQAQNDTMADFTARFADEDRYGQIAQTVVAPDRAIAPAGSIDLAILANNLHTMMAGGVAESVFAAVFLALKPGGVLGVEQHRASSTGLQDPLAGTGYVQEAYVRTLAQEAGLEFVAASDLNANPRDDRDHPFGVWTLPPTLRTAPLGEPDDPNFDTVPYEAIGESDRMTLKFRKPDGAGPVVRERSD